MRTIRLLAALVILLWVAPAAATNYTMPTGLDNSVFIGCTNNTITSTLTCTDVLLPTNGNHTLANNAGVPYTLVVTNQFRQGASAINGPNLSIVVQNGTFTMASNRAWSANLTLQAANADLTVPTSLSGNLIIGRNLTFSGNNRVITGTANVSGNVTGASASQITGNTTIGGTLTTAGAFTVGADLTVNNLTHTGNTMSVTGNVIASGTVNATSTLTIGGNVTANGPFTAAGSVGGNVTVGPAGSFTHSGSIGGNIVAEGTVTVSGTVTGNINSSVPVVNNGTVLGYINAPSVSGTGSAFQTCNFGNNLTDACPVAGAIDHYEIVHDGAALVCEIELVTIRACQNAACDSFSTTSGSFTLNAVASNTTVSVNGSFDGTGTAVVVPLDFSVARSYTLTLTNISDIPLNGTECDLFGVDDCNMEVADSGFIVEAPTAVVAGSTFDLVVRTATVGACTTDLTGVQTLELGMDCINPDICLSPLSGNSTTIVELPAYTELTVNFVDGEAIIPMEYPDAGAITVAARKQIKPNAFIIGALTQDIVSRPANFSVTTSPSSSADDFSADYSQAPLFRKAGEYFSVTIEALNAQGDVTPNYGNEVPSQEPVLLATPNYLAPLSGGVISLDTALSKTDDGQFSTNEVRYNEVGVIQLLVEQSGASYLGTANVTGASGALGRFVPAYFSLVESYVPQLQPSQDDFTYVGQPLSFHSDFPQLVLTPRSVQGTKTDNYANDFFRYALDWSARSYSHSVSCDGLGPYSLSFPGTSVAVINGGDDSDADGAFAVSLPQEEGLRYDKVYDTPKAPFVACVNLQLAASDLTDSDDVCYKVNDAGSCLNFTFSTLQGSDVLDARLRLLPAYAPTNDILDLQFSIEYFDGTGFRRNSRDNSTDYDSSWLEPLTSRFVNFVSTDNLTASELVAEPLAATSVVAGRRLLSAPLLLSQDATPGLTGQFDWLLDLNAIGLPWLGYSWNESCSPVLEPELNPCAPLEFGLFRGNDKVVYQREVGW